MSEIQEPSDIERAELPECTAEYLEALEQIINHVEHLTPLALEEENRQLRLVIEQNTRDTSAIEAAVLRRVADECDQVNGGWTCITGNGLREEADRIANGGA